MVTPSAITPTASTNFFKNVFTGWKKLDASTINGDGYTVNFYRLSERTIDPMCDALNGWYNIWTKFMVELIVNGEAKTLIVKTAEEADKLFEILKGIKTTEDEEGTYTASEKATVAFNTIKNFLA